MPTYGVFTVSIANRSSRKKNMMHIHWARCHI